jgi:putative acetyltransferase
MTIIEHRIDSDEARSLIQKLDAELHERYSASSVHGVDAGAFIGARGRFFIAEVDGGHAGCGALRPLDEASAEIKRMYVIKALRGRGISRLMLNHLESIARDRGHSHVLVETGDRQPEAQSLFRSSGYRQIEAFGEYVGDPHSICFRKDL